MTLSYPCPVCGQVDDLEQVNPSGILLDKLVQWECICHNTRSVAIDHRIPQELVRKAMLRDEMRSRRNAT